jgi:hypothetical protein
VSVAESLTETPITPPLDARVDRPGDAFEIMTVSFVAPHAPAMPALFVSPEYVAIQR